MKPKYFAHNMGSHSDTFGGAGDDDPCYCNMPKCNIDEIGDTTSRCELHDTYHLFKNKDIDDPHCMCNGCRERRTVTIDK